MILLVVLGPLLGGNLAGYSGDELALLSPHLSSGARNQEGRGPAFVGTMDDDFFALDAAGQTIAAADLVETLRAQGVRQVMIYDGDHQLRIQALGDQTVRVLAASP